MSFEFPIIEALRDKNNETYPCYDCPTNAATHRIQTSFGTALLCNPCADAHAYSIAVGMVKSTDPKFTPVFVTVLVSTLEDNPSIETTETNVHFADALETLTIMTTVAENMNRCGYGNTSVRFELHLLSENDTPLVFRLT